MRLPKFSIRQAINLVILLVILICLPPTLLLPKQQLYPRKAIAAQGLLPPPNRPPVTPLLSGPTTGSIGSNINFSFNSFDFDGQSALTIVVFDILELKLSEDILSTQLNTLKEAGVDVIHVDIPWNDTLQPAENEWNFSFFKKRMKMVVDKGFLLQTQVVRLHTGPRWFRKKYPDIDFVSEEGKRVRDYYPNKDRIEYPSYWHPQTKLTFEEILQKFKEEILQDPQFQGKILFSYLPVGLLGEPQYPVIIKDGLSGSLLHYFWAYDPYAQVDFRNDMKEKYNHDLSVANQAWGTSFINWDEVRPPKPGEFTKNYWRDFVYWYKDEKNAYVSWAAETAANYSDRPFYTTALADLIEAEDWKNVIENKGNGDGWCRKQGLENTQCHKRIKKMIDSGDVIPQFEKLHFWTFPANLPSTCLSSGEEWNCFAGKMVQQIWGKGYGLPIIGEIAGNFVDRPEETAEVVIKYGLDGMRYLYRPRLFEIFNSDGTPNENFTRVSNALKRVKNYRDLSQYPDRVKYTIDWGDGTTTQSKFFTPGKPIQFSHQWTQPGRYEVKAKAEDKKGVSSFWSAPLTVEITSEPVINLIKGWNQITWPNVSGYTTKTALEDIDSDCGAGTGLVMARKRKDWFEDFVKEFGGSSFNLQNNQNYFINVSKSCNWNL